MANQNYSTRPTISAKFRKTLRKHLEQAQSGEMIPAIRVDGVTLVEAPRTKDDLPEVCYLIEDLLSDVTDAEKSAEWAFWEFLRYLKKCPEVEDCRYFVVRLPRRACRSGPYTGADEFHGTLCEVDGRTYNLRAGMPEKASSASANDTQRPTNQ